VYHVKVRKDGLVMLLDLVPGPIGIVLFRPCTSQAWATLPILNVDFSADLSSPSLRSLFSLKPAHLHEHDSAVPDSNSAPLTIVISLSGGQGRLNSHGQC
jgi:hypothetical protein